jgi:hypothetical protein
MDRRLRTLANVELAKTLLSSVSFPPGSRSINFDVPLGVATDPWTEVTSDRVNVTVTPDAQQVVVDVYGDNRLQYSGMTVMDNPPQPPNPEQSADHHAVSIDHAFSKRGQECGKDVYCKTKNTRQSF